MPRALKTVNPARATATGCKQALAPWLKLLKEANDKRQHQKIDFTILLYQAYLSLLCMIIPAVSQEFLQAGDHVQGIKRIP